jgi:mono/diheme cytochrome c family protein
MKKSVLIILIFCAIALVFAQCGKKTSQEEKPVMTTEQLAQRGNYLVTIMGCNDCHSPKRMGPQGPEVIPELMLSGYPADRPLGQINAKEIQKGWLLFSADLTAAAGPWGVSFAANLTSDATGIGNWTEENFIRSIKQGKFKGLEGARNLLPPMPWQNYATLPDEDAKAIFAYLKSTKPVQNIVPAPIPPTEIQ